MPGPARRLRDYNDWMHYAEGSAMLPLLLALYAGMLGEAAAPLKPRIDSEIANNLAYMEDALKGSDSSSATSDRRRRPDELRGRGRPGAFDKLGPYPDLSAWLVADACAAGVPALDREGRGISFCEIGVGGAGSCGLRGYRQVGSLL